MRLIYTATRNLAPGQVENTSYEIAFDHARAEMSGSFANSTTRALDGSSETDLYYDDENYDCRTDVIESAQLRAEIESFLHSTAAGEEFTFDPDSNQVGVDVNPMQAVLTSNRYGRDRPFPQNTAASYGFTLRRV